MPPVQRAGRAGAGHHGRHRPPPARPQRAAGAGGARRGGLPPAAGVGLGGLSGGRPLLRAVGLPHHHPPARGVGGDRRPRTWPRSGAAGPGACCRRCSCVVAALALYLSSTRSSAGPGANGSGRPVRPPRRCPRHAALRGQLARHLRPPVLLRPVLDALAAAAHLVAGDRGAVLPGLAAGAAPAAPARGRRAGAGSASDGDRGRRRSPRPA